MLVPAPDGQSWSFGAWVLRPSGGPGPMGLTARWWVATRPGEVIRRDRLGVMLKELRRRDHANILDTGVPGGLPHDARRAG